MSYAPGILNTRAWACLRRARYFVEMHRDGKLSRLDLASRALERADDCLDAIERLGYENQALTTGILALTQEIHRLRKAEDAARRGGEEQGK